MQKKAALSKLKQLSVNRDFKNVHADIHDILKSHSQDAEVLFEIAKIQFTIKRPDLASLTFQKVAELEKKTLGSHKLPTVVDWAKALSHFGKYEQSQKLVDKISAHNDSLAEVVAISARNARLTDDTEKFNQLAQKAYELNPNLVEARLEYARYLDQNGQSDRAFEILELNLDNDPPDGDSIDYWMAIQQRKELWRYGIEKLTAFAAKFPNNLEFVYGLALAHNHLGEQALAREFYEKSIELHPENPRLYYELGVLLRVIGKMEEADKLIEKSLEMRPDNPAAIRTMGADRKYTHGDWLAKKLFFVSSRVTAMTEIEQVHTHYALAKFFEDVGELDTAFRHYNFGGRTKNKLEPYEHEKSVLQAETTKKYVNKALIAQTGQKGYQSEKPIFILGMPRSGTSLLEQILASHPQIYGAGELKYMTSVIENFSIGTDGRLLLGNKEPVFAYEEKATYEQRGKAFVDYLDKLSGGTYERVVDKMPGNFNFLGMIRTILPNAKIIHSRRHPVETCLSNYRIHFAEGQLWSYNLTNLGKYYRVYWDLMRYWREEFAGDFLEVRYEDNVTNLEVNSKIIMDYIGLDWTPEMMEFHKTDRAVKTASIQQVRKPIYNTSMNRWKKYESFLGPLLDEIGDLVEEYEAESPELFTS